MNSRTTAGDFSILESFEYDDNNRLSKWSNPVSGADSYNTYDQLGRIKENDQIGTIKFDNSQKMYQPTGAVLNPAGAQNYLNNLIQTISYNENNDPVFIDGVQGDVSFGYGLTAMRQEVTFGGALSESNSGKYTRFYSEDGSYEVTVDNVSGKEKHLLYIGAGPYEADIIYLKNYTESSGFYRFLHKDYLGSILAITDEEGSKLEQRHYDAWGSLTHLKIANGSIITDQGQIANSPLVLDRGYTSHEHFFEVGIIHMNGRLYDPLLRRFLNADENIQDPANTQNYNKYAYVLNNPLMYNDPSGEFVMLIAVGIAVITSVATDYYLNRPINLPALAQSVIFAVLSAKVSTAIGNLFEAGGKVAAALKGWSAVAKAGAHAVAQGTLSWMQGGNFLSGALAGGFASISTDVLGGAIKKSGEFSILRSRGFAMLTGTVSGGIGSVLGGANFWVGAGQGLMVTTFNYLAHQIKYNGDSWDLDGDGRISLDEANNWYRKGGGKPITLDASKIDLNSVDTSKWQKGGRYGVQTLFNSKEGRVLGNITVEYLGNNQVKILTDTYNFEMHGNPLSVRTKPWTMIRNTATFLGLMRAESGMQYKINFSGVNTIKSN